MMTRKHVYAACLVFVVLTLAIGGMGYRAKSDIEAVVTDQFNHQQLLLAQKIAEDIADHFHFLQTCLMGLAPLWRSGAVDQGGPNPVAAAFFDIFARWNVVALGLARPGQERPVFRDPEGREIDGTGLSPWPCLEGPAVSQGTGPVSVSRVFSPTAGPLAGRRLVAMRLPLAEAAGQGCLVLLVDAQAVAARYAHDVRSGKSGYAWVVDETGKFLDHAEQEFIGHDSLEVRRQRNPSIDWSRLIALMHDRVLPGQTGLDWYVSGWHRERLGVVRKLVAFCPVPLSGQADPGNRWAVALAAPQDEVQGLIGRLLIREWSIVGLFELVVFAGFVLTLHLALRWSRALSRQVDHKTKDLLSAQEHLLRAQRFAAIGEAAARLSHEIKNPLMLMSGFASQVRRHLPKDGDDFDKLGIVEAEAKRLETLLNEVRDFTRPAPPHIVPGDLNATVKTSATLLADALKARAIQVSLDLDHALPPVPHDPARIKQVMLNLLKNAMEAMEDGGIVSVHTGLAQDRASISVADTGSGIAETVRERLFDPFCTTKETGTGLGLTVCQRIVADHHGEIYFASTAKGTVFTVELPLVSNGEETDAEG
jgi:two-component system, NtrC family, sensor histidine kinase HydH